MTDYHATQLTGTPCAPFNCAAASGAMGIAAASGYVDLISADTFRAQANVSCVPGVHSNSGGLFISDVERVFGLHGQTVDYGRGLTDTETPLRWPAPTLAERLSQGFGAVLLGDYDALPLKYRASSTFRGDHSAWVHDYRETDGTLHWHDPLRKVGLRIPISAAISYWQKPTSPIRGYAGFVEVKMTARPFSIDEVQGQFTVNGTGHDFINPFDDRPSTRVPNVADGLVKNVVGRTHFEDPIDGHAGDRKTGYLVNHQGPDGKARAYVALAADGTFTADTAGDTKQRVALAVNGVIDKTTEREV